MCVCVYLCLCNCLPATLCGSALNIFSCHCTLTPASQLLRYFFNDLLPLASVSLISILFHYTFFFRKLNINQMASLCAHTQTHTHTQAQGYRCVQIVLLKYNCSYIYMCVCVRYIYQQTCAFIE